MREDPTTHPLAEEAKEPKSILDTDEQDAVTEIRDSLRLSLAELREQIVQGAYTLIIGEDASGRLPALMARRILQSVAEENGKQGPETLFFAGSRYAGADPHGIPEMEEKMAGMRKEIVQAHARQNKTGKVLVVTDTISSGLSMAPLTEVLRDLGLSYDIVAVGFETDEPARVEKLLGATIHAGKRGYASIYSHQALSGVDKSILDVHAKPYLKNPAKLAAARRLTEEYADGLAPEFKQMKDEGPASTQ